MYGAIKQDNGKYSITEIYPFYNKTFFVKEKLKSLGGKWNEKNRRWEDIDEKYLKDPASKRIKVRLESHCHMLEEDAFVYECQIEQNRVRSGCSMCDTPTSCGQWVKIVKKYD